MDYAYYINQVLVILALYMVGLVFVAGSTKTDKYYFIYAYPAGMALWALSGFVLLVAGITFNAASCLVLMVLSAFIPIIYALVKKQEKSAGAFINRGLFLFSFAFVIAALIACSGYFKVSVSNDSYYYYSLYPQTIAIEGKYLTSFDVFLTDVGQTTAIVNTLPFLFGFEQTYGILLMLSFTTVLFYVKSLMEIFGKSGGKKKNTAVIIFLLLLLTATPFIIMSRWILANAYFICFALGVLELGISGKKENGWLLFVFTAMLSMIRMEGGMMAGLIILCLLQKKEIENRFILKYMLLPVALTQILYYGTVYMKLSVNPLYSFLDFKNAAVMLLFIAAIGIYTGFIRFKSLLFLQKYYVILLTGVLILVNGVLLLVDTGRYIGNLKFFAMNILAQNGWGYFGFMAVIIFVLIPDKKSFLESPEGLFSVEFVLLTMAVCFARDGSLRLGVGDSGNRVLMQIVPFLLLGYARGFAFI